ncbi:aminotransferase class I/II-fold pyridoxal phosphate-dependent enzyme [Streptomyces sp. XH2]|uniref:aminotransferase class I/II-fold pyridoxal phosphate-dependent enzyme n=1 Tax=Streptomyces sp. XH2 TaxID=3412483 RepID=UPI003C7ED357
MTTTDFGAVHNSVLELTDRLRKADRYPLFPVVAQAGPTRARVRAAGCAAERDVTVLASADYLGPAHHPEVRERAADAPRRFGTGTYGSQAVGGFTELHEELERTVAAWFDRPAALLFPSGPQADLGVLGALAGPGDMVFLDRFDHGSITMGARLSGAGVRMFRHNDTAHLEELLNSGEAQEARRRLIVVAGLFSADGDLPPLREIAGLAQRHQSLLIVDEAHSAGALGARGRGAAELLGVLDRVDVITGTFSKSFASTGGCVCANERVADLLRHAAGAYLLTLGLSPATVGAVFGAFGVVAREGAERRRRPVELSAALHEMLRAAGVGIGASQAHVVVPTGTVDRTARIARRLVGEGLLVGPLFPPAVPIGGARLRLGVTAAHSEAELQRAAQLIATAVAEEQ